MSIRNLVHTKRGIILSFLAIAMSMLGTASTVYADVLTSSNGHLVTKQNSLSESTKPANTDLAGLPAAAQATVSAVAGRDDQSYHAVVQGKGVHARNPRHAMSINFTPEGVQVRTGASHWGLTLNSYGYGDRLGALRTSAPNATANRVEYRRGTVTEWYINGPMGLEQGFALSSAPQMRHEGPLTLGLRLSGDLAASVGPQKDELTLKQGNGMAVLRYSGLTAYDATGKQLHAWLQIIGRQLLVRIDDAGALYPIMVDPFVQTAKLIASDGAGGDNFGSAVAISGDTVVVGSAATIGANADQGAVYVFVKPASGWGGDLIETAKLTASDGAGGDDFGSAVAISGDTVVVGAFGVNAGQGAVYVFVKPASGWGGDLTETAKLAASDGVVYDDFGWDVAISNDTVVVGADQFFTSRFGAAYIFVKPSSGWGGDLLETAKLTASDGALMDDLGSSVAISGDTVVVGGNNRRGQAYVFVKPASGWVGQMTETAKLIIPHPFIAVEDIEISDNTVVIGVNDWLAGPLANGALVFMKPASGWGGQLTETAQLTSSDMAVGNLFGYAVSISGDKVVVGDPWFPGDGDFRTLHGQAYVFVKPASGWGGHLSESEKLITSDGSGVDFYFGGSVAISGDTVVVGAPYAEIGANVGQGAAYVFVKPTLTTYTIVATAGTGGNITSSGTLSVNSGDNAIFTITADPGHHIADVSVDGVSQGAMTNYTFTDVQTDHTISASFESNLSFSVRAAIVKWWNKQKAVGFVTMTADFGAMKPAVNDIVSVSLDGVRLFSARFSEFEGGRRPGAYQLVRQNLLVRLDFSTYRLFVATPRMSLVGLDARNGVDVQMFVGAATAVQNIVMTPAPANSLIYRRTGVFGEP